MDLARVSAVLTVPCLCLTPAALAQPAGFDISRMPPPRRAAVSERPVMIEPTPRARIVMIESWAVRDNAVIGLGRFTIADPPRRRTNTERVRDSDFDPRTRNIAGAGLSVRF